MKTLEQRLQEVEDREEIKELTAKYAHWVARGEGSDSWAREPARGDPSVPPLASLSTPSLSVRGSREPRGEADDHG